MYKVASRKQSFSSSLLEEICRSIDDPQRMSSMKSDEEEDGYGGVKEKKVTPSASSGESEQKYKLQCFNTKSGDIKKVKVKQPISPGAKVAAFLNSLFHIKMKINTTTPPHSGKPSLRRDNKHDSHLQTAINEDLIMYIMDKNHQLINYHNTSHQIMGFHMKITEEEDESDAQSDASSDLFELELGIDRSYAQQLPVYQTTHLHQIQPMHMHMP